MSLVTALPLKIQLNYGLSGYSISVEIDCIKPKSGASAPHLALKAPDKAIANSKRRILEWNFKS